jgi:nitric oxide reductase NorD protein
LSENGLRPKDTFLSEEEVKSEKPDDLIHYLPFKINGGGELEAVPGTSLYPEWGDDIGCYRTNWSRVREHPLNAGPNEFYQRTLQKYAGLIRKVKREFQMLRPEGMIKLKRQFDGDEIDLDSAVEYFIDRKLGISPSEKNYTRTKKNTRDIAVSFLVDMSGSTRGRTIQLEKEALVIMSEALCELGDAFSIYGFSGYTRQNVAFYTIKEFSDIYDQKIAGRISAIRDKHSTRIGPALRHTALKLANRDEKIKLLILLSDGKPEDREYYDAYGIEDTRAALKEGQKQGVRPFCITVDKKAPEYLHRMYSHSNWVVINDVAKLPMKITRIYKQLTT